MQFSKTLRHDFARRVRLPIKPRERQEVDTSVVNRKSSLWESTEVYFEGNSALNRTIIDQVELLDAPL